MYRCAIAAVLGLVLLAGCNVSKLERFPRAPKGPVTDPAHPAGIDPAKLGPDIRIVDAQEVDLVEAVLTHRAMYHRNLQLLRDYYAAHGYYTKQKWAEFELEGLKTVKPFRYLIDAEIPGESLRPTDSIPAADDMYAKGRELMRRGGYGVPALYREDLMIEAAAELRNLIEQYPSSDKIDDAAFLLGEIHKAYFKNQELLAVRWYERAWTWDPHTPHPARFEAATVYDFRLHDRDRALELYRAVLTDEDGDWTNVQFAQRRIDELSADTAGQP